MNESKLLAFMPWFTLQEVIAIGEVNFTPFSVSDGDAEDIFDEFKDDVTRILSGYRDIQGGSIDKCTLIYMDKSNPCNPEVDTRLLLNAAHILSFAAIAQNEYCTSVGEYINSSCFETVFQRFVQGDEYICLNIRRRDGSHYTGGYKHGEIKFSMPHQCSSVRFQNFDGNLLKSLSFVLHGNNSLTRKIIESIWLFDEACSDSYMTTIEREVVLYASAFEQLLDCKNKYKLTQRFGSFFEYYSSVKVEDSVRIGNIKFDDEHGEKEKKWFLCRKWIQELYELRSYYVHGSDTNERSWGWNILEHTLMAAFAFPLIVKSLLAQESQYYLTEDDKNNLGAVDKLLNAEEWFNSKPSETIVTWRKIIMDHRLDNRVEKAIKKLTNFSKENIQKNGNSMT